MSEYAAAAAFTDEVLALCAAMQEAAREEDWVTAANLEAARHSLLQTALADNPALLTAAAWSDLIEQVLACDRALLNLGEPCHARMSAQLLEFRRGARARRAYAGPDPA